MTDVQAGRPTTEPVVQQSPVQGHVDPGPMARGNDPTRPSRMIALSNWLVARATGALEKRTSRRGFLVGSAMVGSAVAVSGCMVATQPGTPFSHITDCAGGLCSDGYTDFCCVINDGVNSCPPGSFAGGWWRAEGSSWCGGSTRYYIDCMEFCFGPRTGYQNFCAGAAECRCAGGCDTRKVYCNYFRYGQCHQEIVETGPIACRVVTCVAPYLNEEWACSTADAVDQSTAEHGTACLSSLVPAPVLPPGGVAFEPSLGAIAVAARNLGGDVDVRLNNGIDWSPPVSVIKAVNSAPAAAVNPSGSYVVARSDFLSLLFSNRRLTNGTWEGQKLVPGGLVSSSDPVAITVNDAVELYTTSNRGFLRNEIFRQRLNASGVWDGSWQSLGGHATSNISVASGGPGVFIFARGYDGALWYRRGSGGSWQSLGGNLASDPSAVGDGSSIWVFARFGGRQINVRRFDGASWSPWSSIGGSVLGDPKAVMSVFGPVVVARDDQGMSWFNAVYLGQQTNFKPMPNFDTTGVNPFAVFTSRGMSAFMIGRDGMLYWGPVEADFTRWWPLGVHYTPVSAG